MLASQPDYLVKYHPAIVRRSKGNRKVLTGRRLVPVSNRDHLQTPGVDAGYVIEWSACSGYGTHLTSLR